MGGALEGCATPGSLDTFLAVRPPPSDSLRKIARRKLPHSGLDGQSPARHATALRLAAANTNPGLSQWRGVSCPAARRWTALPPSASPLLCVSLPSVPPYPEQERWHRAGARDLPHPPWTLTPEVSPGQFLRRGPQGLASRTRPEPEVAPEDRVPLRVGAHRCVAVSVDARTRSAAETDPSWLGRFARN